MNASVLQSRRALVTEPQRAAWDLDPSSDDGQGAAGGGVLQERLQGLAHDLGFQGGVYLHLGHAVCAHGQFGPLRPLRFVASSICDRRLYLEAGPPAFAPAGIGPLLRQGPSAWTTADSGRFQPESPFRQSLRVRGIRGGVLTPIHDYAAGPAYLDLYSLYADEAERRAWENGPALAFAAGRFHAQAKTLAAAAQQAGEGSLLTPREIDCLRLAALGLTGLETAQALKVTVRTVEFHLKNAAEKFGASNKVRAVALAVSQGLIEP